MKIRQFCPPAVLPLLFGFSRFDSPFSGLLSPLFVKCCRDPSVFRIEPFLHSLTDPLSAELFCLVITAPYPGEFDVMLASVAACGAYSPTGLPAGRPPLMALRQCRPAYAADVLAYRLAGALISSNAA